MTSASGRRRGRAAARMHVHARGSKRGRPRAPVGYARLAPPPLSAAAPHFAGRPPPGHIDPTRTARWGGARASAACLRGRRRDENARAKPRVRDPWRLPFPRAAAAALLPLAPAAARRATWSSAGKCWAACTGQGRWAQGGGAAPPTPHPLLRWTAKPAPVTLLAPRLRCCTLPWQARLATWADTRVPVEAACATRRTARGGRVFGLAKEQDNPKRSARRACLPPCCAHSQQAQGGVACFARMCRLLVRHADPSVSILAAT